ncbi:MAG: hypothetical protein ABII00_03215 [Elusimicrobiota bacterium]
MRARTPRVLRKRDLKFVALCAATLALVGVYVRDSLLVSETAQSGFRKIDFPAVRRMIRKGELVDREAMYYRAAEARPDEAFGGTEAFNAQASRAGAGAEAAP